MSETKRALKLRSLIWILVVVLFCYLIASNFRVLGNVLIVVIGFGAMIFVHELGHFTAAKLSGIKVEAFSIGMGPVLIGLSRSEKGYKIRILPGSPRNAEGESGEGGLCLTIGKKAKPGETEYRISLVPFGGFVKMLGQDDVIQAEKSDDPRSFANKPVGARFAVIASGVLFNVISAVLLFVITFMIGIDFPPAIVGGVVDGYPAAQAGLRGGDEIIEINGKTRYLDFGDLMLSAALSGWAEEVPITVKHEDGTTEKLYLTSVRKPGDSMSKFGIVEPTSLEIGPVSDVNALKAATDLQPGDRIRSVNGTDVENSWQLHDIVQDAFAPTVSMLAERRPAPDEAVELVETQIRLAWPVDTGSGLANVCSMVPRLKVYAVSPPKQNLADRIMSKLSALLAKTGTEHAPAGYKLGLKPNDIIINAGDVNYPTYYELRDITSAHEGKELPMTVLRRNNSGAEGPIKIVVRPIRQGERVIIGFSPMLDVEHAVVAKTIKLEDSPAGLNPPPGATITRVNDMKVLSFLDVARQIRDSTDGKVTVEYIAPDGTKGSASFEVMEPRRGINLPAVFDAVIPFTELKRTYKANGPVEAAVMGSTKAIRFISTTYATFRSLLERRVGTENMMGPVGILHASYYLVSHEPLIQYAYFIGILSSIIAVLNFLPFPPLDGGWALFLLIEKIKGSPINPKVLTAVAGFGWILIGALFIFITFNDITRWIGAFF